jgi:hypothetical protein
VSRPYIVRSFIFVLGSAAAVFALSSCVPRPNGGGDAGGGPDGGGLPACSNGADDDGDALTDFPADLGCVDGADDDESNPPQCSDGIDNDVDGVVDYPSDPGCDSDVDDDERNPACIDGIDNDGDGDVDYPADIDCSAPSDPTETPDPLCDNGRDDDGDMQTDFPADPGCTDLMDNSESNAPDCLGKAVDEVTFTGYSAGVTTGASAAAGTCGGSMAPEGFSWINVPSLLTTLSINTFGTTWADVVYVETACDGSGTQLGCAASTMGNPALLELSNVAPGGYFIGVDGMTAADMGTYYMHVFGIIAGGQPCTPGDMVFRCDSSLNFDCAEPIAGLGYVCVAGLCSDGYDNDGDAITDWPLDPGCDDVLDNDETDPMMTPECYNGLDDDGDALTDFPADPGCEDTADDLELDQCVPGLLVNNLPGSGNALGTTGGTSFLTASCDTSFMGSGPEAVYLLTVPAVANVTASTANPGTSFNTFISIRDVCDDAMSEVGCGSAGSLGDTATAASLLPGSYFIIIDGTDLASGAYELSVSGTLLAGQPCDPSWARFTCETTTACEADAGSPTGMSCTPADCSDGADNDGDAIADYPGDPGCDNLSDPSETNPAMLPQCADGVDNDADSFIDWPADTGCTAASDNDETCAVFDGPDGFGYVGCSEVPAVMPCADISSTGTLVSGVSDDSATVVTLPFTFDFYGTGYTSTNVVSNGKLVFTSGFASAAYFNGCLPTTASEPNTLFAWWDDLYPGSIHTATTGTAPNRVFEVQWTMQHFSSSPSTNDVRALLYEATGDITVCYVDTVFSTLDDNGTSATSGIEGTAAADYLQYSCNTGVLTAGLVLRYLHP